jgi:hypothetical protein
MFLVMSGQLRKTLEPRKLLSVTYKLQEPGVAIDSDSVNIDIEGVVMASETELTLILVCRNHIKLCGPTRKFTPVPRKNNVET